MEAHKKRKTYRVDIGRFLFGVILRTAVVFIVLWFLERPIRLLSYRVYAGLHTYANENILRLVTNGSIAILLIPAAIAGLLWTLMCIKTVSVGNGEVLVRGILGRGRNFSMEDYAFDSHIKLGSSNLKREKRYLKIMAEDDTIKYIYLPFFGNRTYSALISAIRAEDTELIPHEIRSEIAYENLVGEDSYYSVPKGEIVRAEWKRLAIFSLVCVGGFSIILAFDISGVVELSWYYIVLPVVFGIMVLSIPVELLRMLYNMRRCPKRFKKSGNFLFVDEKGFSLGRIEQIAFTDVKAVSYSIYPKYRYMRVKTDDGIYKYCLGSTFSVSNQSYVNLIRGIERLFINDAMKIVYMQG